MERPSLYPHPHSRAWAPVPGPLARPRPPFPRHDFNKSPKVGTRTLAHQGRPLPGFPLSPPLEAAPRSPRGLVLVGAGPPSTHSSEAGNLRARRQTPARAPAAATLASTPAGHLHSAATARRPLSVAGAEPAYPPCPGPASTARSPPRAEPRRRAAGCVGPRTRPHREVGKLPGVGVSGGVSAPPLCLAACPAPSA